jgi:hypothetical protein
MVVVGYEEIPTHRRERDCVMDERESYREDIDTVECSECWQPHLWCSEQLLEGMELGALMEAKARLSSEGIETFMMVGQAAEKLPGGMIEAWELAEEENISRLSSYDAEILKTYAARITMIEQAREELNDVTFPRD